MEHQGTDRTVSLVRGHFFWPYMQSDIEHYVTKACTCLKPCHEKRAPLTNIVTTHPFELVCIDFLHLDRCKGGHEYILISHALLKRMPPRQSQERLLQTSSSVTSP